MKRIFLYSLLACLCGTMQSCLFSEDDVFEQSSAERENASVAELKELLKNAENGWKLEYRYGEEGNWGVANIFMRFEDDAVIMASDYPTDSYAAGEECKSLYTVQSYHGTELSFDSFNEVLHSFCERVSYLDAGLMGDYEFVVRSSSEDEIQLSGKKFDADMVMTRLADDVDWTAYLQNAAEISDDSNFATFYINVNGQNVESVVREYRAFTTNKIIDGQQTTAYYPFVTTPDGIRMLEPLVYDNVELQNFKWDSNARVFTCTDEGVNADVTYYCPEGYNRYPGNYTLTLAPNALFTSPRTSPISLQVQKESRSYVADISEAVGVSGGLQLVFTYDVARDDIEIKGQQIGVLSGIPFYIYPGTAKGAYYDTTDIVISGTTTTDENGMTITFEIDKYGAAGADSWFLLNLSDGYLDLWTSPVLTKKN